MRRLRLLPAVITFALAAVEGRALSEELELLPGTSLARLPDDHPLTTELSVELLAVDRAYQLARFYLANPFERDLLVLGDWEPTWWLEEDGAEPVSSQWSSDPPKWMRLPVRSAVVVVVPLSPDRALPIRVGLDVRNNETGDERRIWSRLFTDRFPRVDAPEPERFSGELSLLDLGPADGAVDGEYHVLRLTNGTSFPVSFHPQLLSLPEVIAGDGPPIAVLTCGFGEPRPHLTLAAQDSVIVRLYRPYYAPRPAPLTVRISTSAGKVETVVASEWTKLRPLDETVPVGDPVLRFERYGAWFGYDGGGSFVLRLINPNPYAVEYRSDQHDLRASAARSPGGRGSSAA